MYNLMWKKALALTLSLSIIQSCSFEDDVSDEAIPGLVSDIVATTVDIGPDCDAELESQRISFAHLSDLHANFSMQERKFEKLKYFYQTLKEDNPYTIFTNAGDDYEKGSVTEALSEGESVKEAIFAMEFDIRTVGNHDFSWGTQQLLEYVRDPHAKVLASNTKYIGDDDETFDAYDFVEAQVGCVSVGFFGMVSLPWNELDETYDGHFLPEVENDFSYADISQDVINSYRAKVDILVFISHLGVVEDEFLADGVSGVDIILGGHTHGGVVEEYVNDTLIIQPEFYADGISQIDVNYNLLTKEIIEVTHQAYDTSDMQNYDTTLADTLDAISDKYAPKRHDVIAYAELDANDSSVANISLQAIYTNEENPVDVVLLNPNLVWTAWEAGELSQQSFYNAYNVERQKSDTPGFNAIYKTTITGENLKKMIVQQPLWLYQGITGVDELNDETEYKVALNKGPAINITAFFNDDVTYTNEPELLSENWLLLAEYAERRMSSCLYIDTDSEVSDCLETEHVLFDFNSESTPLIAIEGSGSISAFGDSVFGSDNIVTPADNSSLKANSATGNVFKFDAFDKDQGMKLSHNLTANGYTASDDKLAYYSLIFDLYIPGNEYQWLAILQTHVSNSNDAELFVNKELSLGVDGKYFSGIAFDTWHRLGVVVGSNEETASINLYIDGILVGTINHSEVDDEVWQIGSSFFMFSDNSGETRDGYVDNILLVNKLLTANEMQLLGDAGQAISTSVLPVGLNE